MGAPTAKDHPIFLAACILAFEDARAVGRPPRQFKFPRRVTRQTGDPEPGDL
jgi:hypothetical protein